MTVRHAVMEFTCIIPVWVNMSKDHHKTGESPEEAMQSLHIVHGEVGSMCTTCAVLARLYAPLFAL